MREHDRTPTITRCTHCHIRVANPMIFTRQHSTASFCTFSCREAWLAQHTPEIEIVSESVAELRKIAWRP